MMLPLTIWGFWLIVTLGGLAMQAIVDRSERAKFDNAHLSRRLARANTVKE